MKTAKDLWDLYLEGQAKQVEEHIDGQGDHTLDVNIVLKLDDGTFYEVFYQISPGSDYNSWREDPDFCMVNEVEPKQVTKTIYVNKEEK